jgi:hypothetical protein
MLTAQTKIIDFSQFMSIEDHYFNAVDFVWHRGLLLCFELKQSCIVCLYTYRAATDITKDFWVGSDHYVVLSAAAAHLQNRTNWLEYIQGVLGELDQPNSALAIKTKQAQHHLYANE